MKPQERPARRADQKARTRTRLLDAAAEVFSRRGLSASLDEVAEAAGLTKGAVYSSFQSKEALISELLSEQWTRRARTIEAEASTVDHPSRTAFAGRLVTEATTSDRDAFLLELELTVYLARHPERAPKVTGPKLHEEVAEILQRRAAERPLPLPPEDLAIGLIALGRGLALARLTDPTLAEDLFGRWLELVMRQPAGGAAA